MRSERLDEVGRHLDVRRHRGDVADDGVAAVEAGAGPHASPARSRRRDRWTGLAPGERPFREAAPFYGTYRYRPSEEFARLLATHLGWSKRDRVLDLGAGPAQVSTLFAPHVQEVVAMDPDEAMLEAGRNRSASAGVDNVAFVHGGSEDVQRLRASLGGFVAVVMSQSFHWMPDQDSVLRSLDALLDGTRGAVALVGYVNDPDFNRVCVGLDREPWSRAEELRRYLAQTPEGANPGGRHDPFPDILRRSPFPRVELLSFEHEVEVRPSVEAVVGTLYTLSNTVARLGESRPAFEAEVREALAGADTTPFRARLVDSALIGRRPTRAGDRDPRRASFDV